MFKENRKADDAVRSLISDRLQAAVNAGADAARGVVHVQTGRLRGSIRVTEVMSDQDSITASILAGGGEVDYAYEQEIKNPFIRPVAPIIAEAMQGD